MTLSVYAHQLFLSATHHYDSNLYPPTNERERKKLLPNGSSTAELPVQITVLNNKRPILFDPWRIFSFFSKCQSYKICDIWLTLFTSQSQDFSTLEVLNMLLGKCFKWHLHLTHWFILFASFIFPD